MAKAKDAEAYEVPALAITPDKAPVITGNYEVIEKTLEKWKAKVLKMDLAEDNLGEVQTIKSAAVAVRNSLDRAVEAAKKALFNDPKKIFEARVKLLFGLIAEVESKADTVLDKIDQERRDGINEALDHYKTEFQKKYQLDDRHLACLEYRKNYYNKGMEEKARKDDLEQQFKDLKKAQDAHNAGVKLIQATCNGEPRLNAGRYIRDFDSGADVATVVEEINAEKQRLADLDNNMATETTAETAGASSADGACEDGEPAGASSADGACEDGEPATEETEKIVIGAAEGIDFSTDFPGRTKKMKLQLSYPCDLADALTQLFEKLRPCGIKIKQIHEEVAF